MEENIYMLPDGEICRLIGRKVRHMRLRQNFTQMSLAYKAQISVSTLKKIENGEISSFDPLMRLLRVLGRLDVLAPLIRDEDMSPNEYSEFMTALKKKRRKRASAAKINKQAVIIENKSE